MKFYVYEHWRPDTGTCFYVGKGSGDRAWSMRNRNRRHKSVQSKLLSVGLFVEVRIVVSDLEEDTAFLLERDLIAKHNGGLVNVTSGGEGFSGARHTPESKAKISAASKKTAAAQRAQRRERMLGERNPFFGKTHSPEVLAAISSKNKGRKRGLVIVKDSTREKISSTLKLKKIKPPSRAGTKTPNDVKLKQSASLKAFWENKRREGN